MKCKDRYNKLIGKNVIIGGSFMYTEIINLVKNKKVISFDIFDTLLFRNVAKPVDIFKIMENILKNKYGIIDFTKKRIEAESNARKLATNGEANFDEIYIQMEKEIKDKSIINEIKKLEKEKEYEFMTQNPFMKRIFDYCIENNKKIMLISDMYLESSYMKKNTKFMYHVKLEKIKEAENYLN